MPSRSTIPLDEAREFALPELFFSTTDRQGRIIYGNHIFQRISGYEESELTGAPHNIVRHPDMPRCVFKILWDYLEAGRTVAAYVKNLAKDGRYYWVLAVATPCRDGYLSMRFKPTSPYLTTVTSLYQELLAVESQVERETENRRRAQEVSLQRAGERLRDLGFEGYDAFMREALSVELAARRQTLGDSHAFDLLGTGGEPLVAIRRNCRRVSEVLGLAFACLEQLKQLQRDLATKSARLFEVAETLHLESLNAKIAAGSLGQGALVLGAISREMSCASRETEQLIARFREQTRPLHRLLGETIFDIGAGLLETETCEAFAVELAARHDHELDSRIGLALETLIAEMVSRGHALDQGLHQLHQNLAGLASQATAIMARVVEMTAVQFAGKKEALSRNDAGSFVNIFSQVGAKVALGKSDCSELITAIARCRECSAQFVAEAPELRRHLAAVQQAFESLTTGALATASS